MASQQPAGPRTEGPYRSVLIVGLVVAVSIALLLYGRGNFTHWYFSMLGLLFLGFPLSVIGIGFLMRRKFRVALGVFAVPLFFAAQIVLGSAVLRMDVANAKRYCESLVAELEAFRDRTGRYPKHWDEIPLPSVRAPHLIRANRVYYGGTETDYMFEIPNDAEFFGGHQLTSKSNEWESWVD